jgi:hypothetical protein
MFYVAISELIFYQQIARIYYTIKETSLYFLNEC